MEYSTNICGDPCNYQNMKHVGFTSSDCLDALFSPANIHMMSNKITELLMGVNKKNRPIIVPDKTICSVMSAVYENFRPETGDIYARYNIPGDGVQSYVQRMIDETINIITADVKNNLGMEAHNKSLSIWTTVFGDFNKHGLRSHPIIKIRERKPMSMMFNMHY